MKLAVIIPVYNAENTIRKAVKSIDTTHDVEIICINDGSTDRTKQVLTELQKKLNISLFIIKTIKERQKVEIWVFLQCQMISMLLCS